MKAYQEGSELAFEQLYERHSSKVYGYLKKRLSDSKTVEDVFQGTFMKLHQSRQRYDASFPFVPWLFTVCRSVMTDTLRKQSRAPETVHGDFDILTSNIPDLVDPPGSEKGERAIPELSALPPTQRNALELRYSQDLSFEEIAKRLKTSPANVRQLISRAVRKLRTKGAAE